MTKEMLESKYQYNPMAYREPTNWVCECHNGLGWIIPWKYDMCNDCRFSPLMHGSHTVEQDGFQTKAEFKHVNRQRLIVFRPPLSTD